MKRLLFPLLALSLCPPAGAMDYVLCEAMQRRLNTENLGREDRALVAQDDYYRRTAPPKPEKPAEPECTKTNDTRWPCLPSLTLNDHRPEVDDPRWAKGLQIYRDVYQAETPAMRRIKTDMKAAGCF